MLKKIEELTVNKKNKNFSFKGVHKAGSSPDKRFTDGKFIKNVSGRIKVGIKKYEDAMDLEFKNMSADLFSGTAWCFSRPVCDEKLDYIFIDEYLFLFKFTIKKKLYNKISIKSDSIIMCTLFYIYITTYASSFNFSFKLI